MLNLFGIIFTSYLIVLLKMFFSTQQKVKVLIEKKEHNYKINTDFTGNRNERLRLY